MLQENVEAIALGGHCGKRSAASRSQAAPERE
jgi:hypothetical protein